MHVLRRRMRSSTVWVWAALALALMIAEGRADDSWDGSWVFEGDTSRPSASEAYANPESVDYAFDSEVYTIQWGEPMNLITSILKMTTLILR